MTKQKYRIRKKGTNSKGTRFVIGKLENDKWVELTLTPNQDLYNYACQGKVPVIVSDTPKADKSKEGEKFAQGLLYANKKSDIKTELQEEIDKLLYDISG